MQNKSLLRFVSCTLAVTMLAGSVYYNKEMWNEPPVWAWASGELQAQKEANDAEIEKMQSELESIGSDKSTEEAYQKTLTDKIDLQEENITIVDQQLTSIEKDIAETQQEIADTEVEITDMEVQIQGDLENFKSRVRAMYVNGNNSLISALVGASDFFDFLTKYDTLTRIAKHDNDLINGLKTDLEELGNKKTELEQEKAQLEVKLSDQTAKKEELKTAILELQADFEASVEYSEMLADKEALLSADIAGLEASNKELEAEDARILAAIIAAQEEEKRRQEEEERKRQEALAAAKNTTTTAAQPLWRPTTTTTVKNNNLTGNNNPQTTSKTTSAAPVYTTVKTTAAPVSTTTTTTTAKPSVGRFGWPCPGFYTLTSGFGPRWGRHHSGIDIAGGGISGAPVVASLSGTVIHVSSGCSHNYAKSSSCGCGGGYGNYVIVQHSGGYSTVYAHLTSVAVSYGQSVYQGQTLGYAGSTGFSTGPHLHFEVRLNGTRVDPEAYLY